MFEIQIKFTAYQGNMFQLIIRATSVNRAKRTKWPTWQSEPTDYQGSKYQSRATSGNGLRAKDYQSQKDQLVIKANGTNWLSRQMGPTGYQGNWDQLAIKANGTNWPSRLRGPTGYQGNEDQLTIKAKEPTGYQS